MEFESKFIELIVVDDCTLKSLLYMIDFEAHQTIVAIFSSVKTLQLQGQWLMNEPRMEAQENK